MKMKTKIIGLTFMFLFVIGVVLGAVTAAPPTMPYTVVGTLQGDNIVGVTVMIEDLSPVCYGSNEVVVTNEDGQFAVTINNFCERVWEGDTIRATIAGSSVEVILQEGVTQVSFVADEDIYKSAGGKSYSKDDDEPTTTTTIPDETTTTTLPSVTTTTTTIKQDTTTTTLPGDEPDELSAVWKSLIALAIIILGAFSWGKGFSSMAKYYMKKADEAKTKAERIKYQQIAIKMLKTALKNAAAGKYEKDNKGG